MTGKFITFEGIDGSGKSTQLNLLADALREQSIDLLTTIQPGGTPLGRSLRKAFLDTEESVAPMAELLLFAADRAQHVEHLIMPALNEGRLVISDRYADATFAYQGAGRGFDIKVIDQAIEMATGGLTPDLTLFFDIPVDTALSRMGARSNAGGTLNRMDRESAAFYDRVRTAYLGIAEREPGRFRVIDATGTIESIHQEVVNVIKSDLRVLP
ncbi:MAG: dTMP kinase [Pyrinomonadaceae bacterium]